MKVLFISHCKEATGWGKAARDYILALDAAGVEVVPRTITINTKFSEMPERILELESKSSKGCTHCIQHVLPYYMEKSGSFEKNVALSVYESYDAKLSSWAGKINLMDELWTPSMYAAEVFHSMGVQIPTVIIPHAFDLSVYDKEYSKIESPELDGNFVFYTIADRNKRKDLLTTIQAFNLEFTNNEPVKLLIKISGNGASQEQIAKSFIEDCDKAKMAMKLYQTKSNWHKEIVISANLTEEDIYRLHATCDCFITTSHGEAWNIPLFDAIGMKKQVIFPKDMYDYTENIEGYDTYETPVFGMLNTFSDIGSSRECWLTGDIQSIRRLMRRAYTERSQKTIDLSKYSHKNVGLMMKESL